MSEKVLPIALKDDGPIDHPFVLNWAESQGKPEPADPTTTAEDTAFSEIIDTLIAESVSETVRSTHSGIDPGSLVDTSF